MTHPYIPSTESIREEMLKEIGRGDIETLFSDIPRKFLLERDLEVPKMSEPELEDHLRELLSKNSPYTKAISFLGGGVWPHYVPNHIRYLVHRSEFLTSYSPYHPEVGQGMLQTLFEYQSLISELTGMEVVNSSAHDWASALGEAALMCSRLREGESFIVPEFISPERLTVLKSYASGPRMEVERVSRDMEKGQIDLSDLEDRVSDDTVGVYVENPSYLGVLEVELDKISEVAKDHDALFIVGVNPISLGVLKPPSEYNADIVVGEGQPLGIPGSFGGPSLGILACRGEDELLRQVPGRIMGMTETVDGSTRGFCMSLQEREQHISREKATSNLCTTQALNAVSAAIYLSSMGPSGLREVAEKCAGNARYVMDKLDEIEGIRAPLFEAPHFNEFVACFDDAGKSAREVNSELLARGVHGGRLLHEDFPELGDCSLWCSTEIHSKEDIDWMVRSLLEVLEGR